MGSAPSANRGPLGQESCCPMLGGGAVERAGNNIGAILKKKRRGLLLQKIIRINKMQSVSETRKMSPFYRSVQGFTEAFCVIVAAKNV